MAKRLIFGFIAGALSVLVFHQSMVLLLHLLGQIPNFPWSTRPIAPFGVPAIVNQMFWGGLWGVGFAAIAHRIPLRSDLARGAGYGLAGPWLLGNGILVPAFKGGTFLFGLNPMNMWRGALIGLAFGVGIAVILRLLGRSGSARTA
jgi:hypothetical protein